MTTKQPLKSRAAQREQAPWSKGWCILTLKSVGSNNKKMETVSGGGHNTSSPASQTQKRRILLVDSGQDRQARIAILKQHGFRVYPALAIEQARSRCRPGAFQLIIMNADQNPDMALELCEQIRQSDPKQHLLVMTAREPHPGFRDFVVSSIPERLLERVESLLGAPSGANPEPLAA